MPATRLGFGSMLVALTLAHAIGAVSLPISGDEAYYWDCSRHLAWSYFDQPPLVIWTMVPFRLLLGDTRLAVRAPALLASLLVGLLLLPLLRRLGGNERHAGGGYLLLHAMPLFLLGSFYLSTDVAMIAAYVGVVAAAAAVVQGEPRGWWGVGIAVGLGFLAKFPVVLALAALLPVLAIPRLRSGLGARTPWLAAALAVVLTSPVWLWGARHGWANVRFQLASRHDAGPPTTRYLLELVGVDLLLATPFVAVAAAVACRRLWRRRRDPATAAVLLAAAAPVLLFGAVAVFSRVAPHWTAPTLVLAAVLIPLERFRGRRTLVALGAVTGLVLSAAVVAVVLLPERLVELEWSYRGRPRRVSTDKLAAVIGNRELAAGVAARQRPGELVASESYSTVHLLAFLSEGEMETRLAHVKPGKHGLASLYWYRPAELRGADVLFVTEKMQVDEPLRRIFVEVREEPPILIRRRGEVVRRVRVLRCTNLLRPEGVFTRLGE